MKLTKVAISVVFLAFTVYKPCNCSASIQVELVSYENPDHRLSNGRCCEQGLEKNCTRQNGGTGCDICTMECDNQFEINLVRNNVQLFHVNTSTLTYKDMYEFEETFGKTNISNPFAVHVDSYNETFQLSISSFDDDEHLGIDFIDQSVIRFNATTFPPNQKSYFRSVNGIVTTTNLTIRISCDVDFYGKYCDTFCKARDGADGHYKCNPSTGEIVCLRGWVNPSSNCVVRESSIPLLMPSSASIGHSAPIMSQTIGVRASKEVHNSIMIQPTKSIPVQPMTSLMNCDTSIKTVELEMRFEGELNERGFKNKVRQVICRDVNKECYNTVGKCQESKSRGQISLIDVSILGELFVNETASKFKVKISSASGKCSENFNVCTRESIYKSLNLRELLGAKRVEICTTTKTKTCEQRSTLINEKDVSKETKGSPTEIIVAIVCTVLGLALLAVGLLYMKKKKKLMKIRNMEETYNEKIIVDKDTSSC